MKSKQMRKCGLKDPKQSMIPGLKDLRFPEATEYLAVQIPSLEEVAKAQLDPGWTKETLARWGIPWPPPKGWRQQLAKQYADQDES